VRRFSRQEKTTLFIVMFTAFAGLLYRFTGQNDLCIGTAIANRRLREFEAGIGMFVNNVVLRIRPGKGMVSARELLKHVRDVTQEAYDHQDIPFDHVVKELQPERDPSRNPLFQTTFSFHDSPLPNIQIPELEVSVLEILSNNTAKFDLNVIVLPWSNKEYATLPRTGDEGITLIWEYNTDLFSCKTIETMMESYQTFLQGMLADPQQPISTLPLLTDFQVSQQVVEWNKTHRDYPTESTMTCLLEEIVEKFPDRVSMVFQDRQLSYRELDVRANQLARHLQNLGVRRGDFVGIFAERSLEMVIAVYATLKAGAAYVPIDPNYPGERVTFMLHDARVQVLVTQEHLRPRVPPYHGQIVSVDTDWPHIGRLSSTRPPRHEQGDDLAYMIYTSGSTGQPKGAMNTHRGIGNRLHWMQAAHTLQPDDRVLQKAPFSFDVSVRELFWPLLAGARLVMASPEGHRDSQYLRNLILLEDITTIHFVPSMLESFLQTPGIESCRTILRRVLSGGEALSGDLRTKFFDRLPSVALHNLYGPTEAAVDVTEWHCRPEMAHATVPIGRPIPNIQIYLLSAHRQLVPSGLPGELHIGGVGLARGYHRRPDLTAATFIPDHLSGMYGSRLYNTGDLCRYQSDGAIDYLRRLDYQVKVRGYRIEPGEIEAVLLKHLEVKNAAVLCREDCSGEKRLVAYVAGKYEGRAKPDLRGYLKNQIPEYMIPQAFVFLEVLPLTPNGKLDRLALPEPDHVDRTEGKEYVAPRTMMEKLLVEVWQEVLTVERIGIHENFFYLGGHSLLATQIMIRLQNLLGIPIPLRLFFELPILEELAKEIEAQLKSLPDELMNHPTAVN
jgi:amino acid adenylation domain-containing protein